MSDQTIRKGLLNLRAAGAEYASKILGSLEEVRDFAAFSQTVLKFAQHNSGDCRHCYPRIWREDQDQADAELHKAILTKDQAVISYCCRPGPSGLQSPDRHYWCNNRNWTETSCSCECHCFVKNYYKSKNENKHEKSIPSS